MRAVIPTDGVYMVYQEARSHTRAVIPTDGVHMVHQEARSYTRAVIPTDDILILNFGRDLSRLFL